MADLRRLERQTKDGPSDPNALAKWRILNRLHDRNETMYYQVSELLMLLIIIPKGSKLIEIIVVFLHFFGIAKLCHESFQLVK